jgi:addiction module HigA family antidote
MKNPPHPGGFVFRECIEPLGLSTADAAAALGVTRTTLSERVNGKRGISPEMAVRLSKVFDGSTESWLVQQAHHDLAQATAGRSMRTGSSSSGCIPLAGKTTSERNRRRRKALRRRTSTLSSDREQDQARIVLLRLDLSEDISRFVGGAFKVVPLHGGFDGSAEQHCWPPKAWAR